MAEPPIEQRSLTVRGLRVALLEAGPRDGPGLLMLHGFPDSAWSWSRQIPAFAAAGYRVVAPWLRGYPPSEIPPPGAYYDRATLALDLDELIQALWGQRACDLIAQDWGAALSYGLLALRPQRVRRAVLLAVPHPATVRATLKRSPRHVLRSFHWFLFQLPRLPEWLCARHDYRFLETLWKLWSPQFDDAEHVARIRQAFATPGAIEAALAYYRALFDARLADPALAGLRARLDEPITVPTLALCGDRDMRRELLEPQRVHFAGEYAHAVVAGAGHFLHREQPEAVNRLALDWLRRPAAA